MPIIVGTDEPKILLVDQTHFTHIQLGNGYAELVFKQPNGTGLGVGDYFRIRSVQGAPKLQGSKAWPGWVFQVEVIDQKVIRCRMVRNFLPNYNGQEVRRGPGDIK